MIPPAPADFWERVVERVARMVFEREISSNGPVDVILRRLRSNPEVMHGAPQADLAGEREHAEGQAGGSSR